MSLQQRLLVSLQTGGLLLSGLADAEDLTLLSSDAYQPRFDFLAPVSDVIPVQGMSFGLGVEAIYDSNFRLDDSGGGDEFLISVMPSLRFSSDRDDSAMVKLNLEYTPSFRTYFNESDLTGFYQNFAGTLDVNGSRTHLRFYGNFQESAGADRLAGGVVDGSLLSLGLLGTYQIASRTSLGANIGFSSTDYEGGFEGSETITAGLSGNWAYSERFGFGPYFRFTSSRSDSGAGREAYAFMVQANYQASERIRLQGSLGYETGDQEGPVGDLTASYQVTERTSLSASVRYATVPAPSEADYFVQDLEISAELSYQLTYGVISLGVNWAKSFYEEAGNSAAKLEDDSSRYTSLVLSYHRDFFSERARFETSVEYAKNSGYRDYDRWIVSAGIKFAF